MKYDIKILDEMRKLKKFVDGYIEYVTSANTCAYTDRLLESAIEQSKKVDKLKIKQDKVLAKF